MVRTKAKTAKPKPQRKKPTAAQANRARPILQNIELANALANAPDDFEMDLALTCIFFGGSKPIDPSSLYRGIPSIYPAPKKHGANCVRWTLGECRAAKARNAEAA